MREIMVIVQPMFLQSLQPHCEHHQPCRLARSMDRLEIMRYHGKLWMEQWYVCQVCIAVGENIKLHLLHHQSYEVTERVIGGKERKLEVMAVDITVEDLPEGVHIEYRVAALDVLGNNGTVSAPLLISTITGEHRMPCNQQ